MGLLFIIIITSLLFASCFFIKKDYRPIFLLALIFRITLFIIDINQYFHLLHTGDDTENFDRFARQIVQTGDGIHLTHYTDFLVLIYSISGCYRPFAQIINVCFGMGVLFICAKTVDYLKLPKHKCMIALLFIAILPNLNIFSAILLREAWVDFFVALSVYEYIKWYKTGMKKFFFLSLLFIFLGAYMHSGVIGLMIGYIIGYLLYNPQKRKIFLKPSKIVFLGILCIGVIILFPNLNGGKFDVLFSENADAEEILLDYSNYEGRGASSYLQWLPKTTNPLVALIFSPLRMIYFLLSPLPTEWRGLSDILAFIIDGLFYLIICWIILMRKPYQGLEKLKVILLSGIIISVFLFSFGTSNAGTAMRHRAKFFEPLAVLFAMSIYPKNKVSRKLHINKETTHYITIS